MELICKPIGIIHTPHKEQNGTPIQPRFSKDVEGTIEIYPEYTEGLSDLDGFERIWLIFWLHMGGEPKMKVIPYRDTVERGLFATRAPSRPNPIGQSCVKLLRVEGTPLHVAELDMLDGTPLLDIKPYSPEFDNYPDARYGWLQESKEKRESADERFEE